MIVQIKTGRIYAVCFEYFLVLIRSFCICSLFVPIYIALTSIPPLPSFVLLNYASRMNASPPGDPEFCDEPLWTAINELNKMGEDARHSIFFSTNLRITTRMADDVYEN